MPDFGSPGPDDRRVLLVEDDPILAGIVARHLWALGRPVEVAETEEAALQALRAGLRPAVVLLDINLPGESGWALLRSGLLAAAGSPPVYVVSATTVPSARMREFGLAGYLPKPFALETLVDLIERCDGGSAAAGTGAQREARPPGGSEPAPRATPRATARTETPPHAR